MSLFSEDGQLTLEQKLRAGHVTRWHIVRTARTQTIADHMYRVWVYTGAIVKAIGTLGEATEDALGMLALIHDRHEVLMGDVPTPGKEMIEGSLGMGKIEAAGRTIDKAYGDLVAAVKLLNPNALHVLKFADLLEAADFLGLEGIGPHAQEAYESLLTPLLKQYQVLATAFPHAAVPLGQILSTANNAALVRGWSNQP